MSSFKNIKKRLLSASIEARELIAEQLIIDTRPFVPIDTGKLRNSGEIIIKKKFFSRKTIIGVRFGGQLSYAANQYFDKLRHRFNKSGKMKQLKFHPRVPGKLKGNYSAAYRHLRRNNILQKINAKWFDSVLKSQTTLNKYNRIYTKTLKRLLLPK